MYRKFIFTTDILFDVILSHAILNEWQSRGISSMSSVPWLLLGLLFFITAVRKFLKKPPIFLPLFKQFRTILFTFVISLIFLTQWYYNDMPSMYSLLGGVWFFIISITIGVRRVLKKPSLGQLLRQFKNQNKS